jgi:AcrR family transcriptional regulator
MASTDPLEKPLEPLFPRLIGGPRHMEPDEVARHQKDRLEGAMVEAVARHGFAATTVRELVTLAGVSKSTFYDHFQDKEECFLTTFDSIVAEVTAEVVKTNQSSDDFRQRLVAGFGRFMELVVERPEAAAFATVDSLTLGSAGIAHRERSWKAFEQMARQYFVSAAPQQKVSDLTVRAIIAGVSGVVYRRLRSGRARELPELVEPLIDWALSYQGAASEAVKIAVAAAERPSPPAATADEDGGEGEGTVGWEEPPDSPLSRSTLSQRERIIRAAAKVVVERSYDSLSIPAISAAAGTSNQTFYENFKSKREAFLSAYEIVSADAMQATSAAFEAADDLPEAVGFALRALTEHIAAHRVYARLAFVELPTAGPPALDRADETMDRLISFLEPAKDPPPRVVLEATAAGIWFVIQREIAHGDNEDLPKRAPDLARLAIAPLDLG